MLSHKPAKRAKSTNEMLAGLKGPSSASPYSYEAPAPNVSMETRASQIIIRLICPPIILWDIASYLFNKWLGKKVGGIVLPAQTAKEVVPYRAPQVRAAFLRGMSCNAVVDAMYPKDNKPVSAPKQVIEAVSDEKPNFDPEFEPLLKYNPERDTDAQHSQALYDKYLRHNILPVYTHDGAALDTFEINYHQSDATDNSDVLSKNYIIYFAGNGGCAEMSLDGMRREALELQCNQIAFNYRGVNLSKGAPTSKQDLITDGIAQVQRLLDNGVRPEKIILKGFSLGGAVATQVAEYFHERGIRIYLYNDRSFSSLTRLVCGLIRCAETGTGHIEPNRILASIAKPFIRLVLSLTQWEIDAGTSYSKIGGRYKRHILVRSNKDRRTANPQIKDDSIITHYASLHNDPAVKKQRKEFIAELNQDRRERLMNVKESPRYDEIKADIQDEFNEFKSNLKVGKMFVCVEDPEQNDEGHSATPENLSNRFGETASQHFHRFFATIKKMNDEAARKATAQAKRQSPHPVMLNWGSGV